jgi:hypothetical protein
MNDNRKARLKKAEKVGRYKAERPGVSVTDTAQTTHNLKPFLGECPPCNEAISWICDSYEKKVYLVGGRQSDGSFMPTTDFYRLEITSMRWTNLTVKLD